MKNPTTQSAPTAQKASAVPAIYGEVPPAAAPPETIRLILPLPCRRLSPNCPCGGVGARFAKAAAIKKYRALTRAAVEAQQVESAPWQHTTAHVTFFFATKRRRDTDNALASLKSAYDGITESGLIPDDDSEHLTRHMPAFQFDAQNPRVEITLTNTTNQ
jgi:Holliday junction resolvase RusA-like endonuclease